MAPGGNSAEQPDQPAGVHSAWRILLQHPTMTQDFRVLCSLLSCSNTIYAAVTPGTIDLQYVLPPIPASEQAHQFGAWLARYGSILREVQPDSSRWIRRYGMSAAEAEIETGLKAAAAALKAPLLLQLFKSTIDGASNGDVLQVLSPRYLQHLRLQLLQNDATNISRCTASLAELTNLRSLSLAEAVCRSDVSNSSSQGIGLHGSFVEQLLPAVASLTRLKDLTIPTPRTAVAFSYLPVQLEELALTARYDVSNQVSKPPEMNLEHLTALTRLNCFHALGEADRLPDQLEILDLPALGCTKPLLGLEKLRIIVQTVNSWRKIPIKKPAELEEYQQLGRVKAMYRYDPGFILTD